MYKDEVDEVFRAGYVIFIALLFVSFLLMVCPVTALTMTDGNFAYSPPFLGTMSSNPIGTQIVYNYTIVWAGQNGANVSKMVGRDGGGAIEANSGIWLYPNASAGTNITFWARSLPGKGTQTFWERHHNTATGAFVGSTSGWGSVTDSSWTRFTVPSTGHIYGFWCNNGADRMVFSEVEFGGEPPASYPIADFTFTNNSVYVPNTVFFTDTSSNSPTSWYWEFGDGNTSIMQNPNYTFTQAGNASVKLTATNSYGSGNVTKTVTSLGYMVPVCSYSYNPNNGSSPLEVQFTDTSTNNPTSHIWNFNPLGYGFLTVTPSDYNTTANPKVTFSGSGMIPISHRVTNPAGYSDCPTQYVNLSGLAPTPTPTPNIPFPNQTGICLNNQISLGSNQVRSYQGYYSIIPPDSNSFDGFYDTGVNRLISGNYATQIGQWLYNEYNISGSLEWRQSWIVESCNTPTSTPTITPVWTYTAVPTGTSNPYPVPTFTMNAPNMSIPNVSIPSFQSVPRMPETLPDMPYFVNSSTFRNEICSSSVAGVALCPIADSMTALFSSTNAILFSMITFGMAPIIYVLTVVSYVWGLFSIILASWLSVGGIIIGVMGQLIAVIPDKVKNVITLIMCKDIFIQCYELWDWVK